MLHRVHRPASAPAADLASHLPQWKLDAQATQAAHAKDAAAMQAATATVAAQHGPGVLASEAVHVCFVCVCVCVCVCMETFVSGSCMMGKALSNLKL
jgi:hypothetical protein